MRQITLHPFGADSPLLSAATRIYCKTWGHNWTLAYNFISKYALYPGFYGVVAATHSGKPVGMGFGANAFAGNWWYDRICDELGDGHPSLQKAWVLVELSVLRHYRDSGIGSIIIDNLLNHQTQERILLSTQQGNTGARRLYERLQWTYLHRGLVFVQGQEPYVIMCKEMTGEVQLEEEK